jgi:alkylation response protein AidB-like acyl-CoA dehydrogenase
MIYYAQYFDPMGDPVTVLSEEERLAVATVSKFVDDEVRPVVRELEHANTYPEKLIEQMKELGVGLRCPPRATCSSPSSSRGAG